MFTIFFVFVVEEATTMQERKEVRIAVDVVDFLMRNWEGFKQYYHKFYHAGLHYKLRSTI